MVGLKEERPFGTWEYSLPPSFVTSGEFKSFPELTVTEDGTIFILKALTKDGSRVLYRKRKGAANYEEVKIEAKIKNGVNAYGAVATFALSESEYIYTASDVIYWHKNGESKKFGGGKKTFGDLSALGDKLYVIEEDHNAVPCKQSLVQFIYSNPEKKIVLDSGYDFYALPRISPDGKYLVFMAWNDPNMPWDATSVHLVDLEKNALTNIRVLPHHEDSSVNYSALQWSPDSKSFYFAADKEDYWMIYNYDVDEGHTKKVASAHDQDLADAMWIVGDARFYAVNQDFIVFVTDNKLIKKALRTEEITEIPVNGFTSFSKIQIDGGNNIHCIGSGPIRGDSLIFVDSRGNSEVLDQAYDPTGLEEYGFGKYERIDYKVDDPVEKREWIVSGYFYPPVNPRFKGPANQKPPVILMAHGGPTAQTAPTFDRKKAFYQSKGFAIFDVNYRGSTGKGRIFRDALYGRFGDADVVDVCEAVKFLEEGEPVNNMVDSSRVFIAGGSAGGYLLLRALVKFPYLFKAAACSYGFADIYALCSEEHKFEYAYNFHLIAPKEDTKTWTERNMVDKLDKIKTPVTLFHGKVDPVVPYQQSIDIHEALKKNNVKTGLKLFEGEGHGFRGKAVIEDVLDTTYSFFCESMHISPAKPQQELAKL